jgi:putative type I site-specific deoxyribonuclease
MLDYIVNDLTEFRQRNADESLGAMVVCDTSEQAKELYKQFKEKCAKENSEQEGSERCGKARFIPTKASLILHMM